MLYRMAADGLYTRSESDTEWTLPPPCRANLGIWLLRTRRWAPAVDPRRWDEEGSTVLRGKRANWPAKGAPSSP